MKKRRKVERKKEGSRKTVTRVEIATRSFLIELRAVLTLYRERNLAERISFP